MKSILIAAALAIAAAPMAPVASQAASASVTVRTDNDHYRHEHHDRGLHRGWVIGKHKGWDKHEARNDHCTVKKVKTYRDHKVVIKTKRVCD